MALEHLGITPKETRGLLITTITAGIIGVIIIIALVTQVTRLTRRMRRVRTTLDLKMSKKKKAREDNTEYNAMDDRIRNDVHNPYDLYTPNQERNRKDIENIRSNVGMLTKKQGK